MRRCVTVVNGAQSEVRSNTFAAQVLTGDPANQVVLFTSTTTGVIDNNTFAGCGFDECLFIAGAVTISNNHFTHVAGQTEFEFASILTTVNAVNVTWNNNTIHSCAVYCYKLLEGSTVSIQNDVVTVPAGHGTSSVLVTGKDNPASENNVITFADNMVTGAGDIDGANGLFFFATDATVSGNTFDMPEVTAVWVVGGDDGTVMVLDNDFVGARSGVLGQGAPNVQVPYNLFTGVSTGISLNDGTIGLIQGNIFSNCAFPAAACVILQEGGAVSVIGNTMTIDISNPIGGGILANGGVHVIDGNIITGVGQGAAAAGPLRFPMQGAGIDVGGGTLVTSLSNNTIMNAFEGLRFAGPKITVTGTDNVVKDVEVGIQAFGSGHNVTISSSDFTNYVRAMDIFAVTPILTCNWWGTVLGPQNIAALDAGIFTPWALVPVAGTTTTTCTGGQQ
ncbi:MAG: right-handed parallel beta-helix repeat-containing protein [Gemmatimonadetes bacterium]|nr:right-handed parallel beta-helix repeat-containing protein [Gemmatimonadota bacterium]